MIVSCISRRLGLERVSSVYPVTPIGLPFLPFPGGVKLMVEVEALNVELGSVDSVDVRVSMAWKTE